MQAVEAPFGSWRWARVSTNVPCGRAVLAVADRPARAM
jgi:hypothetical protein